VEGGSGLARHEERLVDVEVRQVAEALQVKATQLPAERLGESITHRVGVTDALVFYDFDGLSEGAAGDGTNDEIH
jgi:hypothetical protein